MDSKSVVQGPPVFPETVPVLCKQNYFHNNNVICFFQSHSLSVITITFSSGSLNVYEKSSAFCWAMQFKMAAQEAPEPTSFPKYTKSMEQFSLKKDLQTSWAAASFTSGKGEKKPYWASMRGREPVLP